MSFKGHTFTKDDAPRGLRQKGGEHLGAWLKEQTYKHEIVGTCALCGRALVRGEATPHRLNHASNGNVRAAAGTMMRLTPEDRKEIIAIIKELS